MKENIKNRIYKLYNKVETEEYQGFCRKMYCDIKGEHGIFKERMSQRSIDNVMESFIYQFATILGVPCAFAKVRIADGILGSFSKFEIPDDCSFEHASKIYGQSEVFAGDILEMTENMFGLKSDTLCRLYQYIVFDYITGQQDRHLDNLAFIKYNNGRLGLYKLYDNGLCMESHNNDEIAINILNNGHYKSSMGFSNYIYESIIEHSHKINRKPLSMVNIRNISKSGISKILVSCDIYKQIHKDRKDAIANFIVKQIQSLDI